MFIGGQSNRIWHYWAGKYPGRIGILVGPSYGTKVPIDPWMPFVMDNDAYIAWKEQKPWSEDEWLKFIQRVRLRGIAPLWAAVPDVVANRRATISNWPKYSPIIKSLGWKTAFCVQDGMTLKDVPKDADVVFIGGTTRFKWEKAKQFCQHFPRVHIGRVNAPEKFEYCEKIGAESIDGTGWFRDPSRPDKLPAIERFLEGHRDKTPELNLY